MVYMTPSELGWDPYVNSWMKRMFSTKRNEKPCLNEEAQVFLRELFDSFVDETFEVMNDYRSDEPIQTYEIQSITNVCNFLENFINEEVGEFQYEDTANQFRQKLIKFFTFSFIWGIGGSFSTKGSAKIDQTVRRFFSNILPSHDTVFDYGINLETMKFDKWEIPSFDYDPTLPFFSILVPTIDTVRYSYLLNICLKNKKPVFFTGETGVGKSVIIQKFLSMNKEKMELSPITLNFSAQTDSLSTQQTIEASLIKKKGRSVLGANGNNTCAIFIDDINMPSVEKYGAQPPIELLRQIIGGQVFYDRPQMFDKKIENFVTICSAAPPSGGRASLTPRFTRFFHVFCLPQPSEETMKSIFEGIIEGFFYSSKFASKVSDCGRALVESTVLLYNLVTAEFLPTPSKFHYTFNLRDISKVIQGILMVKSISIEDEGSCARLWVHEVSRVFYDRLVDEKGREIFKEFIETSMRLKNKSDISFTNVRFSNLLKLEDQDKLYEEIKEDDHGNSPLLNTLNQYLDEFNIVSPNKMNLVFFSDAIDHICRIVRVLLQPRGNAMLIGVSGCGKQSLTKLASFMLSYKSYSIKLTKNYKPKDFREDLKEVLMDSGCNGNPYTFLMADTQIINETFLEDINNILNTGDITNLYDQDNEMRILDEIEPYTKKLGRPTSNDVKYSTYIERLRDQFHIIL